MHNGYCKINREDNPFQRILEIGAVVYLGDKHHDEIVNHIICWFGFCSLL